MSRELYEFQKDAAEFLRLTPGCRGILAHPTGFGKSITCIETLKRMQPKTILIVCPAIARYQWRDMLDQWWEGHPHAAVIEYGRERQLSKRKALERDLSFSAPVQIVSYALLSEVTVGPWAAIVFDEAHYLINPGSQQTRRALEVTSANPGAMVLGLSATITPTEPLQIYGPLSVIQPGAWGTLDRNGKRSFDFLSRYSQGTRGKYGWSFEGLNPTRADELRERLDSFVHRLTESDVADILPPISYSVVRVPKIDKSVVTDWVEAQSTDASHLCVFTWHRKQARNYAEALRKKGYHAEAIVDLTIEQRLEAIEKMRKSPKGVIVVTMASVGIAINLGFCERVAFAELHGRAERIIQACGRVAGLRGKGRTQIHFIVSGSEHVQQQAWRLSHRLSGMSKLQKLDNAGSAVSELFDENKLDDELQNLVFDEELNSLDFDLDLEES